MPRESSNRFAGLVEPSAPPIHMMPELSSSDECGRNPPPSYEEAIADEYWQPTGPLPQQHLRPSQTAQRFPLSIRGQETSGGESNTFNRNSTSPCTSLGLHQRNNVSTDPRPRVRPDSSHHRSASSGDLSDGSFDSYSDEIQNINCANLAARQRTRRARSAASASGGNSANRKRKPGSKIKKGLENIAFFIIQILD